MKKPKLVFKRPKRLPLSVLKPFTLSIIVSGAALSLLGYRLLGLVPYGPSEYATKLGSATLSAIKNDTLLAPVKTLQIFILKVTDNDAYIRLASVAVALVAAVLLYIMLRKWYTRRVSLLTIALYITSTWFLQSGRSANTDVLYLTAVPALLVCCMWLASKKPSTIKLIAGSMMLGLTLYVPGTWLFLAFGIFTLRSVLSKAVKTLPTNTKLICGGIIGILVIPLLYSFALKPSQIVRWLGFNPDQSMSLTAIGNNIIDIPQHLFVSGMPDAGKWLGGTPVFEIASVALLVLGFYAYRAGYYASREKLVFGAVIIAAVLIGLGNVATLSLLIPVLYLVIANGIAYLLQSWFTVFPRNPVARPIGVALLAIVICTACFYHLQRYYIAWPRADATIETLNQDR